MTVWVDGKVRGLPDNKKACASILQFVCRGLFSSAIVGRIGQCVMGLRSALPGYTTSKHTICQNLVDA